MTTDVWQKEQPTSRKHAATSMGTMRGSGQQQLCNPKSQRAIQLPAWTTGAPERKLIPAQEHKVGLEFSVPHRITHLKGEKTVELQLKSGKKLLSWIRWNTNWNLDIFSLSKGDKDNVLIPDDPFLWRHPDLIWQDCSLRWPLCHAAIIRQMCLIHFFLFKLIYYIIC